KEVLLEGVAAVRVHHLDALGKRVDVARVDMRVADVPVSQLTPGEAYLAAQDRHAPLDGACGPLGQARAPVRVRGVGYPRVERAPIVVGGPGVEVMRAERPGLPVLREDVRVMQERRPLRHGTRVGEVFEVLIRLVEGARAG